MVQDDAPNIGQKQMMAPNAQREHVLLVDEQDREIGSMEKLAAHQNGGHLHRAFSILLFDARHRWLLQRRAAGKYHFPGLWTNACCSHPRPGEILLEAAQRRLHEELGLQTPLTEIFSFTYTATSPREQLTEKEFDHVFFGRLPENAVCRPDSAEVGEVRFWTPEEIATALQTPEGAAAFTPWFLLIWKQIQLHRKPLP